MHHQSVFHCPIRVIFNCCGFYFLLFVIIFILLHFFCLLVIIKSSFSSYYFHCFFCLPLIFSRFALSSSGYSLSAIVVIVQSPVLIIWSSYFPTPVITWPPYYFFGSPLLLLVFYDFHWPSLDIICLILFHRPPLAMICLLLDLLWLSFAFVLFLLFSSGLSLVFFLVLTFLLWFIFVVLFFSLICPGRDLVFAVHWSSFFFFSLSPSGHHLALMLFSLLWPSFRLLVQYPAHKLSGLGGRYLTKTLRWKFKS